VKTIRAHAVDVFDSEANAALWMATPNAMLDGECPQACLGSVSGRQKVHELLGRIEHGIFS